MVLSCFIRLKVQQCRNREKNHAANSIRLRFIASLFIRISGIDSTRIDRNKSVQFINAIKFSVGEHATNANRNQFEHRLCCCFAKTGFLCNIQKIHNCARMHTTNTDSMQPNKGWSTCRDNTLLHRRATGKYQENAYLVVPKEKSWETIQAECNPFGTAIGAKMAKI